MNQNISFQIVDLASDDIYFTVKDKKNSTKEKTINKKELRFVITLYGINEDQDRIVCHALNYYPYIYLKIPNDWDERKGRAFLKFISPIRV